MHNLPHIICSTVVQNSIFLQLQRLGQINPLVKEILLFLQQHKQTIGNAMSPLLISALAQTILDANQKLLMITIQRKFGPIAASVAISSYSLSN